MKFRAKPVFEQGENGADFKKKFAAKVDKVDS